MNTRITSLLLLFLCTIRPVLAHNDGAYSHADGAVANNQEWMSRVDGSKRLSELSLPGTHDTMSVKGGDIAQNQSMTLLEQLNSGIRVFDMRTRHIDNQFRMHHGLVAQDTYFGEDVLKVIDRFLAAHPSETVLFRLRSEYTASGNSRSYTDTLDSYLAQYGSRRWRPVSQNPELNDIRGRFVILQEFSGTAADGYPYGIAYGSLNIQDDYQLSSNWDLYDKWSAVKNQINNARQGDRNTLYMNYLSGANGSFPYFVVSGHSSNGTSAPRLATGLTTPGWADSYPDFPRVSCFIGICTIAFEGTNVLTADYIANAGDAVIGMVMTDFPGKRLIDNIIRLNGLSPYAYREFAWGTNTDEQRNLCAAGCQAEGDAFTDTPPPAKQELTVVSYNVMRPDAQRLQNQIRWMKEQFGEQGPDIILLSETVRGAACGSGRNTAREYAQAFGGYYVNASEDGATASCQTGNAIVSRYPLGNVGMLRFSTQSEDSDPHAGRNAVFADINVGGSLVHVYSTHTHHSFGAAGDQIRQAQHAEMVYHAAGKPYTKILGGDFNAIGHVFADAVGLHDISLNPLFDAGYQDAHDALATHERISSEAGLLADDWTLILDFIFTKDGHSAQPGICSSALCRNSSVMSDHTPVWASVRYQNNSASASAIALNEMKRGENYLFKLNTRAGGQNCRLEWDGSQSSGERNAKFDCSSSGDPMILEISADPWIDHAGRYALKAYIYAPVGGTLCGLEWDGALADGERNAKFDCQGGKDEFYITSTADGKLSDILITSVGSDDHNNDHCGLQWTGGDAYNGERNAKFDCDPAWDAMSIMELEKNIYRELRDARSGKCLDFSGSVPDYGKEAILWDCADVDWQQWHYDAVSGLLRNKANPDFCLDNKGERYAGGSVHLWLCTEGSINQQWDFIGNTLRPRVNHDIALDAFATENGSQIGQWNVHGGDNQQWRWAR